MSTTHPTPALEQALRASLLARQRCLQAAQALEGADLYVAAHAFRFTAAQEREHAAILQGMAQAPTEVLPPDAPLPAAPEEILLEAIRREDDCAEALLPAAAREARNAGHTRAADALLRLADNERRHARRFRQYLDALQSGTLLHGSGDWICLVCGSLHHGESAPESCESCGRSRGHFIRSDYSPFALS